MPVTKEEIAAQALQMFAAEGFRAVRMEDLAVQMGISKRTLYEHFADKEALIIAALAIHRDMQERLHRSVDEARVDMVESMFRHLQRLTQATDENRRLSEELRKFYPRVWEKVTEMSFDCFRSRMLDHLADGHRQGIFRDEVNDELAISTLYVLSTALILQRSIRVPEGMTEGQAIFQVISGFFRGLVTMRGVELIEKYKNEYKF